MKYRTVSCAGHYIDDPKNTYEVSIALDSWDEVADAYDERIFFYMDGEPLEVGTVIAEDFLITEIYK